LYRAPEQRNLELQRNIAVERVTIQIQAVVRRVSAYRLLKKMKAVKPILVNAIKARSLDALDKALDSSKDIEFDMKLIRDCKNLKACILKEREIANKLGEYIGTGPNYKASLLFIHALRSWIHSLTRLFLLSSPTCKWSPSTKSFAT